MCPALSVAGARVAHPAPFPLPAHRTGRVQQTAPVVTSSQAAVELPIIGVSALLQLVDWYQAHELRHQQGGSSCVNREAPLSPPPPSKLTRPSKPGQLWLALPGENREQILNALSRVVAEHLTKPPVVQEVTHEQL